MRGRIAMMSCQVSVHHGVLGFNLEYELIFKLGKQVVTDWMEHIEQQRF